MATSLNDVTGWIKDIYRRLRRLESGTFLESSSISSGRMRFIGGLLLIDSGGTLQVVGHLNGDGDFVWHGPWAFTGAGEITGDVDLTGNLDVLDDGAISAGGILIKDGKIYVGTGANRIVIDGATGKLLVGDMALDPNNHGGYIKMPNGAEVLGYGANVELYSAGAVKNGLIVTPTGAKVQTLPSATSMSGLHWVARDPVSGELFDVAPDVGGP